MTLCVIFKDRQMEQACTFCLHRSFGTRSVCDQTGEVLSDFVGEELMEPYSIPNNNPDFPQENYGETWMVDERGIPAKINDIDPEYVLYIWQREEDMDMAILDIQTDPNLDEETREYLLSMP